MIDTHCHFDFPPFIASIEMHLKLVAEAGVSALIVPTVTAERIDTVLNLARNHLAIYAAIGLHPLYIAQHGEEQLQCVARNLAEGADKIVAVGEIGLDFYHEQSSSEQQCWLLRQQLYLADRADLPVILHSRRSHVVLLKELKQVRPACTGVLHGFSGSLEQALDFVKLGYAIGVGGVISYPRAQKTRRAIAGLPLTSLVLETDAPDMPLCGFQGEANHPNKLALVLAALCELRSHETPEEIADTLYQNTLRLFPRLKGVEVM